MSKNTRNRILLTAVAALLLVVMAVGGTLAYLTDVTPVVSNTFTPADVHISLTETPNQDDGTWTAQLIPGKEYMKDPIVTVDDALTNVDLWVFVKVEDTNASTYLDFEVSDEWDELIADSVYYRAWTDGTSTEDWYVLTGTTTNANGAVTVKSGLTADQLYNANASLSFTAYAIQQEGFKVGDTYADETAAVTAAWNAVKDMSEANDGNLDAAPHETEHVTDGL